MGIFRRKQEKSPEIAPGPLDERVRALESSLRQLDADFDDLFDRFTRLQGRRAKRVEREDAQPDSQAAALNEQIRGMYSFNRRQ